MQVHQNEAYQALISTLDQLTLLKAFQKMEQPLEALKNRAEQDQDSVGLAAFYYYQGVWEYRSKRLSACTESLQIALAVCLAKEIPYYCMKSYLFLGVIHLEKADFHICLTNYLNAYHLAKDHPEFMAQSEALYRIGNLFACLEEHEAAVSYLEYAHEQYLKEQADWPALLRRIVTNLVEECAALGDQKRAQDWKDSLAGQLSPKELAALEFALYSNQILQEDQLQNAGSIKALIHRFLELSKNSSGSDVFRVYLNALKIAVELEDAELSRKTLERMESLQADFSVHSYDYRFAELKMRYAQCFLRKGVSPADAFADSYYETSRVTIEQLLKNYARSLILEIELDQSRYENNSMALKNEQLQKDIEKDIFTDVYNKVSMEKHVERLLRTRQPYVYQALFLIDIDCFKQVNDRFGHHFGDQVIVETASLLLSSKHPDKIVGRFGGDEFVLFLDNLLDAEWVRELAQELLMGAHKIQTPEKETGGITFSIGVCLIEKDTPFARAFQEADQALYQAKNAGRDRYMFSAGD